MRYQEDENDAERGEISGVRGEEERRRESAEELLAEHTEAAEKPWVDASSVIRGGSPAKRILELAEEGTVDLVVTEYGAVPASAGCCSGASPRRSPGARRCR